jgi:hypothetical protein
MAAMPPRLDNAAIQRWVQEIQKAGLIEKETKRMKEILVSQTCTPHSNTEFQSIVVDNANRIFRWLLLAKSHGLECFNDTS